MAYKPKVTGRKARAMTEGIVHHAHGTQDELTKIMRLIITKDFDEALLRLTYAQQYNQIVLQEAMQLNKLQEAAAKRKGEEAE